MVQFLLLNLEPERETFTTGNFNGVNYNNLINIPLTESLRNQYDAHVSPKKLTCLRFACVNARSLRNKTADVVDHVVNSNIDMCVVTETWLKDADSVTIAALSPDGYCFQNSPRSGGGVGVMYKSIIGTKLIHANQCSSFESSEWNVTIQNHVIKLVAVYRPPSSSTHPQPMSLFFEEFSTYLESIVISTERLLISGDFNLHIESSEDTNAKKFCELLETFGLIQHVAFPTHTSGHTLDLIISRSINDVIITELESTLALSDHSFIECNLNIPKPNFMVKEIRFRQLKRVDIPTFKNDISSSELCVNSFMDIDELSRYDTTLSSILDKHAPMTTKRMVVRRVVPWFTDDLKKLKAERRKCERKMLQSGCPNDKELYYRTRDKYSARLRKTKISYYSDLIDECSGNSKKLFRVINALTKQKSSESLPPYDDPLILANGFGTFFG